MILYNPQDPTSEIIFNHQGVAYESRRLQIPTAEFQLGEWVGLLNGEYALTIDAQSDAVLPRMVYTNTDRHDVQESENVTVAVGNFHLSTMMYITGESFVTGTRLIVSPDSSIGKLASFDAAANGDYWVVGACRKAPAADGTDRLIAEIWNTPVYQTKS